MVEHEDSREGALRRRAARAVGWSIARIAGDQLFGFLVFAALARTLDPATLGIFIVGLAVAEVGKIVAQGGLVSSLYRAPALTPQLVDTVFWANLGMGVAVALACLVLQHPLARAMGSAEAAPVIAAMGFVVPISAAGASHMSRTLRAFGHRALAARSLGAGIVGGCLALWAADAGWGVWALVFQRFASETIGTLVAWRAFRWRPGFAFSWRTLREQWRLGVSVASSQVLIVTLNRMQDVILARTLGPGTVGVYRTAWKAMDVIAQGAITPVSTVSVPTLAKLQHDMPAFRRCYVRLVSLTAMIALPAMAGVGVMADRLIPLLFGEHWEQSVPVARVLCLLALPVVLNFFADPALTVLGKAGIIARLAATQVMITLLFCLVAAPYGIVWFAAAYVARAYLTMVLQMVLLQRSAGIRARDVAVGVAPAVGAAVVMALVVWTTADTMPQGPFDSVASLLPIAFLILQGTLVYAAVLLTFMGRRRCLELVQFAQGFSIGTQAPD
jgi:O-antigen/teichoic acid export membrane protein